MIIIVVVFGFEAPNMTPALETPSKNKLPWAGIAWFGLLLIACYAPVLRALGLRGWGGFQLVIGALGAELFTTRMSFVVTLIGVVWTLGGNVILRKLAFPLFLLFLDRKSVV